MASGGAKTGVVEASDETLESLTKSGRVVIDFSATVGSTREFWEDLGEMWTFPWPGPGREKEWGTDGSAYSSLFGSPKLC